MADVTKTTWAPPTDARQDTNEAAGSPPRGAGGVQSAARALSILELFNDRRLQLTTNEIAVLTGLNRGTAYRFCRTLLSLGYLEEVGSSTFRPGIKCVSLAQAVLGSRDIVQMGTPLLQSLRDRLHETVNMAILDDTAIVYVVRILNSDLVTLRLVVGSRLPSYATSMGRVMLAFLPPDEANAILDRSDIQPLTNATLVDRADLQRELQRIKKSGYAYNDQGVAMGVRGIAAPILDGKGRAVAAVNLSIARPLTDDEVKNDLAPEVMATAAQISARVKEIGHN